MTQARRLSCNLTDQATSRIKSSPYNPFTERMAVCTLREAARSTSKDTSIAWKTLTRRGLASEGSGSTGLVKAWAPHYSSTGVSTPLRQHGRRATAQASAAAVSPSLPPCPHLVSFHSTPDAGPTTTPQCCPLHNAFNFDPSTAPNAVPSAAIRCCWGKGRLVPARPGRRSHGQRERARCKKKVHLIGSKAAHPQPSHDQ